MKMNKKITLGLLGLTLTGCGWFGQKKDEAAEAIDRDLDAKLVGVWERGCEKVDLLGIKYRKTKLDFNINRKFTREMTLFEDSQCQGEISVDKQTGLWTVEDDNPAGGRHITFNVQKSFVDPRSDKVANEFNAQKYCNFTDWEQKKYREVTDANCRSALKADQQVEDIYLIENGDLYFGKTGFFMTDNKNAAVPSELDKSRPYAKK